MLLAHFRRILAAVLCIICLAWSSPLGTAQTSTDEAQVTPPPGVDIQINAQPKVGTVGDPIQIDLDITTPPGYQVEVPRPVAKTNNFAVLEFFSPLAPPGNENPKIRAERARFQHHRARIVIAIYDTGRFAFPSIRIPIKTSEGKEISLSSPQVDIEIKSVLTDKNPRLRDLKKQAKISEPVRWALWLSIAFAFLILGVIVRHFRRRPRHPVALSPEQTRSLLDIAETELRDLLGRGLPERGTEKQFYVRLSEIAKKILEAGYTIHTAERTTEEILDALHGNASMDSESAELIESFLLRCDVVKFAKYIPSVVENEAISKDSMQILAKVKKAVGGELQLAGSESWSANRDG